MALFKSSEPTPGVKASEKINADRFARIPQAFGDGEFWKKYYDLAVKEDDTTTKRLTAELDILLLFVSMNGSTVSIGWVLIVPAMIGWLILWNQHSVHRLHYPHAQPSAN